MLKSIITAIANKVNTKTYMIQVVAKNYETKEVETFTLDNIAYNNFMIHNFDYNVISAERI